jgi:hypothetical protein
MMPPHPHECLPTCIGVRLGDALARHVTSGLACGGDGRRVLHVAAEHVPARITVSSANAHLACVRCRDQAVPRRTSD